MANKVTNVEVKQVSDFLFKLYFDQIAGSRNYNLYIGGTLFKKIDENNSILLSGPRIEYIVTGINPDQIINLTLKAVVGGVEGDSSDPIVFMTEDNRRFFTETTIPLGAGNTFTGQLHDAAIYKTIFVTAYSDQNGTIKIQQSGDKTNWDLENTQAVAGGTGISLNVDLSLRYVRIVYDNGGVAQTIFRLFSTLI